MAKKLWMFSALDTLFFRSASPFNAGEGGQSGVSGCFPPFMTTLQGAVRSALAFGQGWTPEEPKKWPKKLGNHDDLGDLKLEGPYLMCNEKFLFPAPLFLMHKQGINGVQYARLVPGEEVECDLGSMRCEKQASDISKVCKQEKKNISSKVCLPRSKPNIEGLKHMENTWLTKKMLQTILDGGLPDCEKSADESENKQIYRQDELWSDESRVGIEMLKDQRVAEDGKLYSCVHVRPGTRKLKIHLVVLVVGISKSWHRSVAKVDRLGGEARLARIQIEPDLSFKPILPIMPECAKLETLNGKVRFTVILITPGYFEDTQKAILFGPPEIPGQCVSACIGKTIQVGGWDLEKSCPRPLRPLIPAGSAWFFEADSYEINNIHKLHKKCVGIKLEYGFGQIVIGRWGEHR